MEKITPSKKEGSMKIASKSDSLSFKTTEETVNEGNIRKNNSRKSSFSSASNSMMSSKPIASPSSRNSNNIKRILEESETQQTNKDVFSSRKMENYNQSPKILKISSKKGQFDNQNSTNNDSSKYLNSNQNSIGVQCNILYQKLTNLDQVASIPSNSAAEIISNPPQYVEKSFNNPNNFATPTSVSRNSLQDNLDLYDRANVFLSDDGTPILFSNSSYIQSQNDFVEYIENEIPPADIKTFLLDFLEMEMKNGESKPIVNAIHQFRGLLERLSIEDAYKLYKIILLDSQSLNKDIESISNEAGKIIENEPMILKTIRKSKEVILSKNFLNSRFNLAVEYNKDLIDSRNNNRSRLGSINSENPYLLNDSGCNTPKIYNENGNIQSDKEKEELEKKEKERIVLEEIEIIKKMKEKKKKDPKDIYQEAVIYKFEVDEFNKSFDTEIDPYGV